MHVELKTPEEMRVGAEFLNKIAAMRDSETSPATSTGVHFTAHNTLEPAVAITSERVGLDGEGLPWDERIHSGSKKLTDKGVWARRKNVDDAVWNAVRAELQGRSAPVPAVVTETPTTPPPLPAGPGVTQQSVTPQIPVPATMTPPGATIMGTPAPIAAPAPAVPVYQAPSITGLPPSPAPTGVQYVAEPTWADVCFVMKEKLESGKTTHQHLEAIGNHFGVTPFAMLTTRKDTWKQVFDTLFAL